MQLFLLLRGAADNTKKGYFVVVKRDTNMLAQWSCNNNSSAAAVRWAYLTTHRLGWAPHAQEYEAFPQTRHSTARAVVQWQSAQTRKQFPAKTRLLLPRPCLCSRRPCMQSTTASCKRRLEARVCDALRNTFPRAMSTQRKRSRLCGSWRQATRPCLPVFGPMPPPTCRSSWRPPLTPP